MLLNFHIFFKILKVFFKSILWILKSVIKFRNMSLNFWRELMGNLNQNLAGMIYKIYDISSTKFSLQVDQKFKMAIRGNTG